MKVSKIIWLLIASFLFLNSGNADVVGGHDRQRLALFFFAELNAYFDSHPITIQKSVFPLTLAESPQTIDQISLFDVLTEEGWLERQSTVTSISDGIATRAFAYSLTRKAQESEILLGRIDPIALEAITKNQVSTEEGRHYTATFSWQFTEPAPSIWAPTLQQSPLLATYIEAMSQVQLGTVVFKWQEPHWVIEDLRLSTAR